MSQLANIVHRSMNVIIDESTSLLSAAAPDADAPTQLRRGLQARHLIMMSVGGTIGTGLFVASGSTIAVAGPVGSLIAFGAVGVMVFLVLTALGEMSTLIPVSGSFHSHASRFVSEALGATLGWSYWLQWSISLPAEIAAVGIICSFWFPTIPPAAISLMALVGLLLLNSRAPVRSFGEVEYQISLLKVASVLGFIVVGILAAFVLGFPAPEGGGRSEPVWFQNWMIEGAPIKNGLQGVIEVVAIAFFSFGGTELVGVSAGEVENPQKNVPLAINQTFWRILIFYVSSVAVIGLLIPNDDPSLLLSASTGDITIAPFTLILLRFGVPLAPHIMNFVILSAVVSAANSALYAASRTLMALSLRSQAPSWLSITSSNGIPVNAVLVTVIFSSVAFLGTLVGEGVVFRMILTLTGSSGLLTWMSICVTHIRFRSALRRQGLSLDDLHYRAPFGVAGDYLALLIGFTILMGQVWVAIIGDGDLIVVGARVLSVFLGIPFFVVLYLYFKARLRSKLIRLEDASFD